MVEESWVETPALSFSFLVSAEDWRCVEPAEESAYRRRNGQKSAVKGWGDLIINKYVAEQNPCCRFRVFQAGAFIKPGSAKANTTPYFTAKIECQCSTCTLKCKLTVARQPLPGESVRMDLNCLSGTFRHLIGPDGNPADPGRRPLRGLARRQMKEELLASKVPGPLHFSKAKASQISALAEAAGNYSAAPSDVVVRKLLSEIYREDGRNLFLELDELAEELERSLPSDRCPGFFRRISQQPRFWTLWTLRQLHLGAALLARSLRPVAFLQAHGGLLRSLHRLDPTARRFLSYSLFIRPTLPLPALVDAPICPLAELHTFNHQASTIAQWLSDYSAQVAQINAGQQLIPTHLVTDLSFAAISAGIRAFNNSSLCAYNSEAWALVSGELSRAEIESRCWVQVSPRSLLTTAASTLGDAFDLSFRNILCGLAGSHTLAQVEKLLLHSLVVLKSETLTGECEESLREVEELLATTSEELSELQAAPQLQPHDHDHGTPTPLQPNLPNPFYQHFKPLLASANAAAANGDPYGELEPNPYCNKDAAKFLVHHVRFAHLWTGLTWHPMRYAVDGPVEEEIPSPAALLGPGEAWAAELREKLGVGLTPAQLVRRTAHLLLPRVLETQHRLRRQAPSIPIHAFKRTRTIPPQPSTSSVL